MTGSLPQPLHGPARSIWTLDWPVSCRRKDLVADMVSAGMAWAFTHYSSDYIGQEKAAIGARLGVHAHDCDKAWDWRRR